MSLFRQSITEKACGFRSVERRKHVIHRAKGLLVFAAAFVCINAVHAAEDGSAVSVTVKQQQRRAGMTMYDTEEGLVPNYVTDEIVVVTARKDAVEIEKVIVNRGNCKVNVAELPKTLKFGEQLEAYADCDPIEVTVQTTKEALSFTITHE